jgi:hypothetical protein
LRIKNLKLINDLAIFWDDNFADQDAAENARDDLNFEVPIGHAERSFEGSQ